MTEKQEKNISLSIIIVNYNLAKEIENCLNSLLNNIDGVKYEIIIVDNNSTDKYLTEVEKKFNTNNISFYYLDKNIGFGQGCNFGVSKSSGKYLCFLNPDTIIIENIFVPIINLFESSKSIGIIGPKQQIRRPCFDFSAGFTPNIFFELFNILTIGVFFEAVVVFLYGKFIKKNYFDVGWILGACLFISADIFNNIGGFDKDYFMFFEETDLCKRVKDKSYRVIYFPSVKIKHIGSVSGKRDYSLFTKRIYSSKYIYISKHFKMLKKNLMKVLLLIQLITQIILWIILFPMNKNKSKQKLNGFFYLLNNKMKFIS